MHDLLPLAETVPLAERSLHFVGRVFADIAVTCDARQCRNEARKSRELAALSAHPLLCLARAAWWSAVADHLTPASATDAGLTGS